MKYKYSRKQMANILLDQLLLSGNEILAYNLESKLLATKQSKGWEERFDEFDTNEYNHRRCYECEGSLMTEKLINFIRTELEKARAEALDEALEALPKITLSCQHFDGIYYPVVETRQKIEELKKVIK